MTLVIALNGGQSSQGTLEAITHDLQVNLNVTEPTDVRSGPGGAAHECSLLVIELSVSGLHTPSVDISIS